jgi:hypothetical protein
MGGLAATASLPEDHIHDARACRKARSADAEAKLSFKLLRSLFSELPAISGVRLSPNDAHQSNSYNKIAADRHRQRTRLFVGRKEVERSDEFEGGRGGVSPLAQSRKRTAAWIEW